MCVLGWAVAFGDTVELMDGKRLEGAVAGIGADAALSITVGNVPQTVRCDEVLSIRFRSVQPSSHIGQALVLLRNGDVVVGTVAEGTKSSVTAQSLSLGKVEIKFDSIQAIEFVQKSGAGAESEMPRELAPELLEPPKDQDVALLLNGDRLPGVLNGISKDRIQFNCALGDIALPFEKLLGVALAPGPKMKPPEGLLAHVVGTDGSSISGSIQQTDAKLLRLNAVLGTAAEIPLDKVASIAFRNGRAIYLSDLEPVKVTEEPFVRDPRQTIGEDYWWHYRRDRNVSGGVIRLGRQTFLKGMGVHSRCELTYKLDKAYSRFISTIGVDDETGGRGSVAFRVLADGKPLYPARPEDSTMAGKDAPRRVDVDVSGASELTLGVDFANQMHIFGRADWAGARLIKKP